MASKTAYEIMYMRYKGYPNLMTPEFCSIYKPRQNVAVELSKGKGISNQDIYGVTVVAYDPITNTCETIDSLSTLFESHMEASLYIHGIGDKLDELCTWDNSEV